MKLIMGLTQSNVAIVNSCLLRPVDAGDLEYVGGRFARMLDARLLGARREYRFGKHHCDLIVTDRSGYGYCVSMTNVHGTWLVTGYPSIYAPE